LSELAGEVDSERHGNLTSAIRLFVLAARHPVDGDLPLASVCFFVILARPNHPTKFHRASVSTSVTTHHRPKSCARDAQGEPVRRVRHDLVGHCFHAALGFCHHRIIELGRQEHHLLKSDVGLVIFAASSSRLANLRSSRSGNGAIERAGRSAAFAQAAHEIC
jgi:hypothetical protein